MTFSEQARLSELHRLAQSRLQTVVAGDVAKVFPLLDVTDVDKTFGAYYDGMKKVITARRTISSSLSASLYDGIRKDANISSIFTPVLNSAINEKQLFTSLLVTGPISIKKSLAAGASIEQANANALTSTIRASQRHVANGGRGTIINAANRDKSAKGWARLTDSKPCSFCAMLASRGPVYKSEGSSRFRSHDGCGCSAVPVFDLEAPWPGRAEEFRAAYDQNISGKFPGGDGNNDAVKAWKKYYDTKINPDAFNQARNVSQRLVDTATAAEGELTASMERIAAENGGELHGLKYRLKEVDSLTRKINTDVINGKGLKTVEEVGRDIFDANRYTMTLAEDNYVSGAQRVIDGLRAEGQTVNVKNFWTKADNPYQGINLQVTDSAGLQYELQLHTSKSLAIKEGELHDIYERSRKTHDLIKIAKYNKQSFAAAAKIPVPRGIEGILWGKGLPVVEVVPAVKKVAKKAAAKVATTPEWRKAWDEAAAKLPADKTHIGRVPNTGPAPTMLELNAAEKKLKDLEEFTKQWSDLNQTRGIASVTEAVAVTEQKMALKAKFEAEYGVDFGPVGPTMKLNHAAYRTKLKFEFDSLKNRAKGGEVDIFERQMEGRRRIMNYASGEVLDAQLDAVLEAGAALGTELDLRIAASIARKSAVKVDSVGIKARLDASRIKWTQDTELVDAALLAREAELKAGLTAKAAKNWDGSGFSEERYLLKLTQLARGRDAIYKGLLEKKTLLRSEFNRESFASTNAIKAATTPIERGTVTYADIQREETLKLLSEIREIGGKGPDYVGLASEGGLPILDGPLFDAMQFAHSSYPTQWMETARAGAPQVRLFKSGRGYNQFATEISLSFDRAKLTADVGYNAVAVHEFGHSMQRFIPGLKELDFAYRSRRATIVSKSGATITQKLTPIYGASKEVSLADNWREAYSGRVYSGNNTTTGSSEVFTTGIESLLGGSGEYMNAKQIATNAAKLEHDIEFRDYMLGVLSVL